MSGKIRHLALINLKHEKDSPRAKEFLEAAKRDLGGVPSVREYMQNVTPPKGWQYGLLLEFDCEEDLEAYENHPLNQKFTEEYWIPDVLDYMDINFKIV